MQSLPVGAGYGKRFALILLLALGASGCKEEELPKHVGPLTCGDKIVNVNLNNGSEPEAVYVCEGDKVTWIPNKHTFLVEFKKDSPFEDEGKKFDNGNAKSKKTKPHDHVKVYEYRITVDTTHVFDPQVIGGGTP